MELRFLKDDELEISFHRAAKTERKIMHIVILHIQEIERRKLYLARKYDSIHKYLTGIMKYSSSSANRRIHAAILVTAIPSVALKIESGEINLTQIGELQRAVKNAEKIHQEKVSTEQQSELIERLINLSTADSQQVCAEALNIPIIEAQSVKVQKDKSRRVGFTFSERQFAKYEVVRGMLAHKNFQAMRTQDIPDVLETLFDEWTALQIPEGKSQNRNASKSQKRTTVSKNNCNAGEVSPVMENVDSIELISASNSGSSANESAKELTSPTQCKTGTEKLKSATDVVDYAAPTRAENQHDILNKDQCQGENLDKTKWHSLTPKRKKIILQRDQCCQFKDHKTGHVCGSIFNLNVDHIQPKWAGGSNDPQNLRVLCQQHNLYRERMQHARY